MVCKTAENIFRCKRTKQGQIYISQSERKKMAIEYIKRWVYIKWTTKQNITKLVKGYKQGIKNTNDLNTETLISHCNREMQI